ncbi:hypothetical protein HG531_006207 [Fusarium graminearum]|nr:hypothetical protein HG531_006207 [Fusarium graminearum]
MADITKRDTALKDLKTDLGPLADGLKSDTTVDKSLSKITTVGAEGVCADDNGTRRLVGLEESESLAGCEEVEELFGQDADVLGDSCSQKLQIGSQEGLCLGSELVVAVLVGENVRLVAVDVCLKSLLGHLSLSLGGFLCPLKIQFPCKTLNVGGCELLLGV